MWYGLCQPAFLVVVPRYDLGNNGGVIPSRQSFLAVIFQEGKEFSCNTVPLALRIGDQLLAGFIYFINVASHSC